MGMAYENQRVIFNQILQKYKEYVALYKAINNGSLAGLTQFGEFYWRYTYYSKYSNPRAVESKYY